MNLCMSSSERVLNNVTVVGPLQFQVKKPSFLYWLIFFARSVFVGPNFPNWLFILIPCSESLRWENLTTVFSLFFMQLSTWPYLWNIWSHVVQKKEKKRIMVMLKDILPNSTLKSKRLWLLQLVWKKLSGEYILEEESLLKWGLLKSIKAFIGQPFHIPIRHCYYYNYHHPLIAIA